MKCIRENYRMQLYHNDTIAASQTEEIENKIRTENKEYKTNKNMKKQVIRLTEDDLHRIIKKSMNKVLKESVDSVSPDPFGTSAESYHNPSDEELRQSDAFNSKYRPWSLECKDIESIIEWAFYRKDEFKSGKYDIVNLLSDLYRMI